MTHVLRQAGRPDIAAMHRVRTAVRENRLSSPGRITEADYVDAIERSGRGWVVESDGQVAGFAVGLLGGNIWALFVHPDHEGRGYGKALHDAMVGWLRSQGVARLWLTTAPGTRAERFYVSRGWRPCGIVQGGEMRLELDAPGAMPARFETEAS